MPKPIEWKTATHPLPRPAVWPEDWQDRVKRHLDAQIEAGATLYGRREDGAYVAYSKDGEWIIEEPGQSSD